MWKTESDERRLDERRRGLRGSRGPVGPAGPRGVEGPRGKSGKTGAKGEPANFDSLAALEAHVVRIDQELRIQLHRIAQLQQELDSARGAIKKLGSPQLLPAVRPARTDH